jgi:phage shock protein C
MKEKKLVRPIKGRVFLGVAQGLANYFEIDPLIVRIIFIFLIFWNGLGIILYLIGFFTIPSQDENAKPTKEELSDSKVNMYNKTDSYKNYQSSQIFGVVVILIGLLILIQNFFPTINFIKIWPLALILIGLGIIFNHTKEKK